MLMFTDDEIKIIQARAKHNPIFLKTIEEKNNDVIHKAYIQQKGKATWLAIGVLSELRF